jgi:hypothetical protein
MYMKAITLGLAAALAFSAASGQAAAPVTFTVTVESGAGVLTPTYISGYSYFDGGNKLNINTVLRDEAYTFGNERYVYHWADTSYDRQGGYRDTAYWSVDYAGPAQAPDYVYFKATAAINPDADQTVPMTFDAFTTVRGTYSSVTDPRFPNVKLYPASVTIASANSHNAADLVLPTYGRTTWFRPDGTFSADDFSGEKIIPAGGTADFSVLLYVPAQLHATSYSIDLTGPLYDIGLHHFSETNFLGYEVQAVPEPTTWAMLLAGVGILGAARRRKTAA